MTAGARRVFARLSAAVLVLQGVVAAASAYACMSQPPQGRTTHACCQKGGAPSNERCKKTCSDAATVDTVKAVQGHALAAALDAMQSPAVLPSPVPTIEIVREPQKELFATDSGPPGPQHVSAHLLRAPPALGA